MLTLNKITIIGYVGQDPVINSFPSGKQYASFSVATTENWIDKNTGEKKQLTEWHRIISFTAVDFIKEFVHSGSPVYLEGSLKKREFIDKDTGEKRQITEIIIHGKGIVNLLDSKNKKHLDEPNVPPPVLDDFPKDYGDDEL